MKGILQRIVAMGLVLCIALSTPIAAKASEGDLDQKMKELGAPQELIDIMTDDQKRERIAEGVQLESYTSEIMIIENPDYTTYGTIPSAELYLSVSVWDYSTSYNGRTVIAYYDWIVPPFWRLTDEIGIAWDDNLFVIDPNSWSHTNVLNHMINGEAVPKKVDMYYDLAALNRYGAVWDIPLYSNEGHINISTSGSVSLRLINKYPRDNQKCQVVGNYLHKKITPTVSLTIGPELGIGVSGVGSYDTKGVASKIFEY